MISPVEEFPKPKIEFCYVEYRQRTRTVPWEHDDYIHKIVGRIEVLFDDQEIEEEHVHIGDLHMYVSNVTEAFNDYKDLFDVFDAHSQELHVIYTALFGHIKSVEDLDDDDVGLPTWPQDVLYIDRIEWQEEEDFNKQEVLVKVFETSIATYVSNGVVATFEEGWGFDMDMWKHLGFVREPQFGVVYRDKQRVNPYRKKAKDEETQ